MLIVKGSPRKMTTMAQNVVYLSIGTFIIILHHVNSFLFMPNGLPTLLQLMYTKRPQFREGTDSRFGIGFRLGDHADFQILFELGPQTKTEPIGNGIDLKRKRSAKILTSDTKLSTEKTKLVKKNEKAIKKIESKVKKQVKKNEYSDKGSNDENEGSKWLLKWRQELVGKIRHSISSVNLPTKTVPRHINQMKVVESTRSHDGKRDNDLIVLKRLFENANKK